MITVVRHGSASARFGSVTKLSHVVSLQTVRGVNKTSEVVNGSNPERQHYLTGS